MNNLLTKYIFITIILISAKSSAYTLSELPPNLNNPVRYSEQTINFMLSNKKMDAIEGKYRCISQNDRQHHRIAIIKNQTDDYLVIFLHGASYFMDWQQGDEMGFIPKNSELQSQYYYAKLRWFLPNRILSTCANLAFSGINRNKLLLSFSDHPDILVRYEKEISQKGNNIHLPKTINENSEPTKNSIDDHRSNNNSLQKNMIDEPNSISYGSSVAISKDGYIVTNEHVVNGAKNFEVTQYQWGDSVTYDAQLIYTDAMNDIAVLKINDHHFSGFDEIPYSISTDMAEQGEDVYTLGYPLCEQLGKEVKLEKGLINSPYGYGDDAKAYGTNIKLLPGNSGGPLFSLSGNLEGIVYSRFSESDNMSYAIRSQVLVGILHHLSVPIPNQDKISHLPLTEQVKKLKPFAFRVAAYK
ncbi:MAG: serine protease [Chitinophagales bacterium]